MGSNPGYLLQSFLLYNSKITLKPEVKCYRKDTPSKVNKITSVLQILVSLEMLEIAITLYSFSFAYHTSSSSVFPGRKELSRFRSSRDRDKILRRDTIATGRSRWSSK